MPPRHMSTLPTKLRYLSVFMVTGRRCQRRWRVSGHRKPGLREFVCALSRILDTQGKKCSFTFERSNSEPVELPTDAPTALVDEMR